MRSIIILSALILLGQSVFSQNRAMLDSVNEFVQTDIADSIKVMALNKLGWTYKQHNLDSAVIMSQRALEVAKNGNWQRGVGRSYHQLGVFHKNLGNYQTSLSYYDKALEVWDRTGDRNGLAITLGNKGIVFRLLGDYSNALSYYEQALRMSQEMSDSMGIADNWTRIGLVYWNRGDHTKALQYYFKSLRIYRKLENISRIALTHGNIGLVYWNLLDYPKALEYYEEYYKSAQELGNTLLQARALANTGILYLEVAREDGTESARDSNMKKALNILYTSLNLVEETGEKVLKATIIGNIAGLYIYKGDIAGHTDSGNINYYKALRYLDEALELTAQTNMKIRIATWLGNKGGIYTKLGQYDEAERYILAANTISHAIEALQIMKRDQLQLSVLYAASGRYEEAFHSYKLYSLYKDSLFNEDKSKELGKLEAKHEFETAEAERKRLEEDRRAASAKVERWRNNLQYSGILIFLLLVFTGVFMLARFSIPIRLAEGMIFFSFLLFFEFTLVLLDPYIEEYSSGAPAVKLAFNAVLAAMIFPLHSFFERKMKKRLT